MGVVLLNSLPQEKEAEFISIKRRSAFHIFPDIDALYIMCVIRYERYPRTLGREVIILVNLITKYKHKLLELKF